MSREIVAKIDEILKNEITNRHSFFQLRYFIVGKEPTIQSKLWCCLRELKSRRADIEAIDLELEEAKDQLLLLDIGISKIKNRKFKPNQDVDLIWSEREIKIRRLERRKVAMDKSMKKLEIRRKECLEEASFFSQAFESLEKMEKYKGFDDLPSQLEYWNERLTQDLNMTTLLMKPIDTELAKTILAMNDEAPIKAKTLTMLRDRHEKLIAAADQKTIGG